MRAFDAAAVFDRYCLLPNAQKLAFLRPIGPGSTADAIGVLHSSTSAAAKYKLAEKIFPEALCRIVPVLVQRRACSQRVHAAGVETTAKAVGKQGRDSNGTSILTRCFALVYD